MDNEKYKKILLIQLRRMGDVIVTTPIITILREKFKFAQIDFLTEQEYEQVLSGYPDLNNVITYDRNNFKSMLSVIGKIRKEKYDIIFDFFGNPRSAWITFFSGAKTKVGYDYRVRKFAYNVVVDLPEELLYVVDYRMLLLKAVGIDGELIRPYIFIPKDAREFANKFFEDKEVKENDLLIGMVTPNTRARSKIKNWTREGYITLSKMLMKYFDAKILLLWGPGEEREKDYINMLLDSKAIANPPVDIKQLSALVKRCQLIITNCGGTRHIAVSVGTPTLTIYGPTHSVSWTPPDSEEHQVIKADVPCLGCNLEICEKWDCMKKLSAGDVFKKAEIMLLNILRKNVIKKINKSIL